METVSQLARMIDHSLLHPTLTDEQLVAGCKLAKEYQVASVCIKPYAVEVAKDLLQGSPVRVGTVIGFPQGGNTTQIKAEEARMACQQGAMELDVVANIGKVLSQDWDYVSQELATIMEVAKEYGALVKVIFENDFLHTDDLKIKLCQIVSELAVDYAKTSTGYGFVKQANGSYAYRGATDYDLKLMRNYCNPQVQIKAAGGVRTLDDLLRVRKLGVTRVGATATQSILEEAKLRFAHD